MDMGRNVGWKRSALGRSGDKGKGKDKGEGKDKGKGKETGRNVGWKKNGVCLGEAAARGAWGEVGAPSVPSAH